MIVGYFKMTQKYLEKLNNYIETRRKEAREGKATLEVVEIYSFSQFYALYQEDPEKARKLKAQESILTLGLHSCDPNTKRARVIREGLSLILEGRELVSSQKQPG